MDFGDTGNGNAAGGGTKSVIIIITPTHDPNCQLHHCTNPNPRILGSEAPRVAGAPGADGLGEEEVDEVLLRDELARLELLDLRHGLGDGCRCRGVRSARQLHVGAVGLLAADGSEASTSATALDL